MFVTSNVLDELGDTSQETVKAWHRSPVVVGIDPARKIDSTVVTVVWVDWDRPDEFGYFDHRILNWLEIQGDDWEEQYFQIVNFLENYDVLAVGVDANGVKFPPAAFISSRVAIDSIIDLVGFYGIDNLVHVVVSITQISPVPLELM
jgi:hypothetical protein